MLMSRAASFLSLLPDRLFESAGEIKNYLAQVAQMKDGFIGKAHPDWKYSSVEALLLDHGKEFSHVPPEAWPPAFDFTVGEMKACFMNASRQAHHPEVFYCEGYATSVIPMNHAWVTVDGKGAIDTTWHTEATPNPEYGKMSGGYDSSGSAYFGIPFTDDFVRRWQMKTGYYGIFGDATQQHLPELLKDGLPDGAVAF